MNSRRRPRPDRQVRPKLEAVEARELLSGVTAMLAARAHVVKPASVLNTNPVENVPGSPPVPYVPGQGVPTPHELIRQRFHATFSGPVVQGPGRFSDQAKTLYYRGVGGSNQFLHGSYQMAIVFPTDPTQPIVGGVYMQDRNANSGGQIGFDLTIDPNSLDRFGRPTRATFVGDPNVYSGIYYSETSLGTVKIRYFGQQAAVLFDGQLYTSGLTGPFQNLDLYYHR